MDLGFRIQNSGVKGKTQKVATQTGDEAMEKLKKILDKCRCPGCGAEKLVPAMNRVICGGCKMEYGAGDSWVDFVGSKPEGQIAQEALETWGKRLHFKTPMEKKHELHFPQFGTVFGTDFEFITDCP